MSFFDFINLVGLVINFIAALFLSAGFIKSKDELIDENETYFDRNPFKLRNELTSRPYYRWGFRLLIIGFSINISALIVKDLSISKEIITLVIAAAISLFGFVLIQAFETERLGKHRAYKKEHLTNQFIKRLGTAQAEANWNATIPAFEELKNFENFRNIRSKELRENLVGVDENIKKEAQVLIDTLELSTSIENFAGLIKTFIEKDNIKSKL